MRKKFIINFCLLLILFSYGETAIASPVITPPQITVFFEPNSVKEYSVGVSNQDEEIKYLTVSKDGELTKYIELLETNFTLNPKGDTGVNFLLKLPDKLEPGTHTGYVKIKESMPEELRGRGVVAIPEVAFTINVIVPYPGDYLELYFNTEDNVQAGTEVKVNLFVKNLGTNDEYNVKNNVEFFDLKDNKSMGVLTLDPFDIVSTDSKSIYASYLVKNWNLGVYNAVATLYYAEKTTQASKTFTVGDIKMEILGLNQTQYEKGKINKVGVISQSKWNQIINNVYSIVALNDQNGKKIEARSANTDFGPWDKKEIPVFLDLKDVDEGLYNLDVEVFYMNKSEKKSFEIKVSRSWINTILSTQGILILIIIILVAILIYNHIKSKKKLKKK